MDPQDGPQDEWIRLAAAGDRNAMDELLAAHRSRLRQVVAVRLDGRMARRIDASDVVQESLMEASRRLPEYQDQGTVPFFVWLRQLAWQRLAQLYRFHCRAQRRSVVREVDPLPLSHESVMLFADRLAASGMAPSRRLRRQETQEHVRSVLARMAPADQEVLVLRHLEQLSTREIAAVLKISEPAVRHRQRRALQRLTNSLRVSCEGGADARTGS
jgi:RNA polymerase sigma-70 factor (ECF subfamily)